MLRYSELQQSQYLACNALGMDNNTKKHLLINLWKKLWKSCGKVPFLEGVNRGI